MLPLLLVEDSVERYDTLLEWLPSDMRLVWAHDADAATGFLAREGPTAYAGVVLAAGVPGAAAAVVPALLDRVHPDIPILIHSTSGEADEAAMPLEDAGFSVTHLAWQDLTRDRFLRWVEEVREVAEPLTAPA
jgi:hypothetical protein